METNRKLVPGDIYKHFKNKLYQIVTVAIHSETKETYVVYQALYGDFKTYIRPYDMFMSEVDRAKYPEVKQKYRFEKVEVVAMPDVNDGVYPTFSPEKPIKITDVPVENLSEREDNGINPYLMEFFDKNTYSEKIEYLTSIRKHIDDRFINDICASLDITVDDGDIDFRYSSLIACLSTMARFECGRLR